LTQLFPNNTDLEGTTCINACYGGTAALLNAFLWCESSAWDGRYAIVVAADIATYAAGPARPTCGAGAVAVLVGRDAPLSYNPKLRATHATHVWDFFKPDHTVEYPTVDGALSQVCYYQALEDCYTRFCEKMELHYKQNATTTEDSTSAAAAAAATAVFDATTPDYFVFHAPYNKLVQKSYARLFLMDARKRNTSANETDEKKTEPPNEKDDLMLPWLEKAIEDTYEDKALEKVLKQVSQKCYQEKLKDSNAVSIQVGNTYTASVFLGLASLIDRVVPEPGKLITLFSYGSGALATMYALQV
jgi:hydroxymethylglutaryl-CoA synthase